MSARILARLSADSTGSAKVGILQTRTPVLQSSSPPLKSGCSRVRRTHSSRDLHRVLSVLCFAFVVPVPGLPPPSSEQRVLSRLEPGSGAHRLAHRGGRNPQTLGPLRRFSLTTHSEFGGRRHEPSAAAQPFPIWCDVRLSRFQIRCSPDLSALVREMRLFARLTRCWDVLHRAPRHTRRTSSE